MTASGYSRQFGDRYFRFTSDCAAKVPKCCAINFPQMDETSTQSPIDVALRPLPRSPVSSSLDNVVPQSIIRSPRVRPGEFVFSHAKRLLQQNQGNSGHLISSASCPFVVAGSTGRRNTGVKSLCWGFKLQGLTWPFV